MNYSYAWQKAYEALTSLTASGDFDRRLVSAGLNLGGFPTDELPPEVQRLALVAERAFTMFPDGDPRAHPDGTVAALIDLLPEQRKRHLAEKVVSLFEAICELRGALEATKPPTRRAKAMELTGPDKWEFLFWNLSSNASESERREYVEYAQHWLPNFPSEVLLEWQGRHGYDGMKHWSHLDLRDLHFEEHLWTYEDVAKVQAVDPAFTEVGPGTMGGHHLNRPGDWVGEYIRKTGTWSAPIIVMRNPVAVPIHHYEVPAGLVLVEGHKRLSRLLNMPEDRRAGIRHRVWVGQLRD